MYTFSSSGPRATYQGYTLRYMVMEAFKLKRYQLSLGASARLVFLCLLRHFC